MVAVDAVGLACLEVGHKTVGSEESRESVGCLRTVHVVEVRSLALLRLEVAVEGHHSSQGYICSSKHSRNLESGHRQAVGGFGPC